MIILELVSYGPLRELLSYVGSEAISRLASRRKSIVQLLSINRQPSPTFSASWTLGRDGDRDMIGLSLIALSAGLTPADGKGISASCPIARCDEQEELGYLDLLTVNESTRSHNSVSSGYRELCRHGSDSRENLCLHAKNTIRGVHSALTTLHILTLLNHRFKWHELRALHARSNLHLCLTIVVPQSYLVDQWQIS